jgi:hypothetical protein
MMVQSVAKWQSPSSIAEEKAKLMEQITELETQNYSDPNVLLPKLIIIISTWFLTAKSRPFSIFSKLPLPSLSSTFGEYSSTSGAICFRTLATYVPWPIHILIWLSFYKIFLSNIS